MSLDRKILWCIFFRFFVGVSCVLMAGQSRACFLPLQSRYVYLGNPRLRMETALISWQDLLFIAEKNNYSSQLALFLPDTFFAGGPAVHFTGNSILFFPKFEPFTVITSSNVRMEPDLFFRQPADSGHFVDQNMSFTVLQFNNHESRGGDENNVDLPKQASNADQTEFQRRSDWDAIVSFVYYGTPILFLVAAILGYIRFFTSFFLIVCWYAGIVVYKLVVWLVGILT